jgi:nitrite reductase/ring-hydroxylating ferredoxin subunit
MAGFASESSSAMRSEHGDPATQDPVAAMNIPEGFQRAVSVSELPDGALLEVFVGDTPVAIANLDGEIMAIGDTCPHAGGPIGDGELDKGKAVCPYHGWAFDLKTGICDVNSSVSVPVYEVLQDEGYIYVKL